MLDPIDGSIVLNELHRLERKMFEDDWAHARAEYGDRATVTDPATDGRPAAGRCAGGDGSEVGGADPHAVMPRPLFTVLVGFGEFSNVCELSDGTVVIAAPVGSPPRRR